jgi:hypothetical protein
MIVNQSGIVTEFIVESSPGASCEGCALPGRAAKLMRVPAMTALCCSILCAEQGIGERGCRWCGEKLNGSHGNSRFCSESCKSKSAVANLGDGRRVIAWLRRHAPELVRGSAASHS